MKIVGVIPSRLKSNRVPRKPLLDIMGLPMVVHVYKRACMSEILDDVYVATDSEEIKKEIESHGGKVIMTSEKHTNGTERLVEAAQHIDCDYVVLINGDEAIFDPKHIEVSVQTLLKSNADASILALKFYKKNSPGDFKLALNIENEVMYISRNDIPSDARNEVDYYLKAYHLMTFTKETLLSYAQMKNTRFGAIEDHEHLRMIEQGKKIKAAIVESSSVSVDTDSDLSYVREYMKTDPYFKKYGSK